MRIATWNVNSIRARADRVLSWLERTQVDVLAIQETKCSDKQFPSAPFHTAGYTVEHYGFNQWNGVAFISRYPLSEIAYGFPQEPEFLPQEAKNQNLSSADPNEKLSATATKIEPKKHREGRALGVTCQGIRLWSIYVPNGRELSNPHYRYKLDWLKTFYVHISTEISQHPDMVISGDWNIAPYDNDVWDISVFADKTHVSFPERERFFQFLAAGFSDPIRNLYPDAFTYWDYTQLHFPKNQGMRIDFSLLSSHLVQRFTYGEIDRNERKGKGASDHVPIILDLADQQ